MDHVEIIDYKEGDQWDWDAYDPNQYCRHGNFIGSWWGPDILCGNCEMGEDPTLQEMLDQYDERIRKLNEHIKYARDIATYSLDVINTDSNGYAFLNVLSGSLQSIISDCKKGINTLLEQRAETFHKFSRFSDDDENDRGILYKRHSYEKALWNNNANRSR